VLNRLLLALILLTLFAPVRGQTTDGPIKMTPEFPLVFPLTKNGDDVTVKYPVLIGPTTILKPGMVLRTIYIINFNMDGSADLAMVHHGDMEQAYSRPTSSSGDLAKLPYDLAHEIEGYRRTVWQTPNNFVLAMAQYPTDTMHLIYQPTHDNRDLEDARFSFFDGLFLGLPDGKVTVLAVEKESKAEKAGLKAGDEILAVGGVSTQHDLTTFTTVFAAARKIAKENEAASYPMTVISEGGKEPHTANIPTPPTIKSQLMHGF
jgi:hypothetical protein